VVSIVCFLASFANATLFSRLGKLVPPPHTAAEALSAAASISANVTGSAFFTQLLDHDHPSKGTFQQKFWWNAQYWEGPGSPVSNAMR